MMRLTGIFFLLALVLSCGQQPASESQAAFDTTGFVLEDISGAPGYQRAIQYNDKGVLLQEGLLLNGVPEGTWIQYGESSPLPLKLISFVHGKYDGPYIEYGQQGQVKLRAYYKENELDGYWSQFSFGRLENSATYKKGQLDGPSYEYDKYSGKLQKEIHYQAGKLHGSYRFFNEAGELTMEYEYRDGEKISGGMIEGE